MIRESVRVALLLLVGLVLAGLAISYASGCGAPLSTQANRVQSAITVLAEVLDPAYELATRACVARERVEVTAERDGGQAPEVTDQHLKDIRASCDAVAREFDRMRTALAYAEEALDDENIQMAQAKLQEVRDVWARLRSQ